MEPTPQLPQPTEPRLSNNHLLGALTLCLVFVSGGYFSWTYLADASEPQAAAAIVAIAPPPAPPPPIHSFDGLTLQARSAIIVDETTGRTLYELNADTQWPLASLTKVALALAVAEVLPANAVITVPYDTAPKGSYQRLGKGEHWSVQDIIDFTLAASSNTGADILAGVANGPLNVKYKNSPADDTTLWRMNDIGRQLHLSNTYFLNDNGLDESATQSGAYGSARNVASLFAYAVETTPTTFAATTKSDFRITSADGAETAVINTDEALPAIPGIVMGKTGYTDLAGGNLAVVFDNGGHRFVAVVLGSSQQGRFDDMEALVARTSKALQEEQ